MAGDRQFALKYCPEPTPTMFHRDPAPVRLLMGPLGCGKSTACVWEILLKACAQEPHRKTRRSRWAVIRNSYPELVSTTINTWKQCIPEEFGEIKHGAPITTVVRFELPDHTFVHLEVYFLSLDKEKDVKKLLGIELTGAWINEAREVPRAVLEMLTGRVGRYPPKNQGGMTWSGVIMDTNPPDDDHWMYELFEEEQPEGYRIFKQPPAIVKDNSGAWVINPDCEAVIHQPLGAQYWLRQIAGKREDWILIYLCGCYGSTLEGKPVYPEYKDTIHCAEKPLDPYRGLPIIIGMDFGLTPAAAICQNSSKGEFRAINECVGKEIGLRNFLRNQLRPLLSAQYQGMDFQVQGDPAGNQRAQTDELTCYDILREEHFKAFPARTNDLIPRREAVAQKLTQMIYGKPCFQLSPVCKWIRKGFISQYVFERVGVSGDRYKDVPTKNMYSHCLAQGTLVSTPFGKVCIEKIRRGDLVLTHLGPRPVANAWMTGSNSHVTKVTVEGSDTPLLATGHHLVFVLPGRWIPVDALEYGDVLLCIERDLCENESIQLLNSTEFRTTESRQDTIQATTGSQTSGFGIFIAQCGSFITETFRKVKRFITRMVTRRTTTSQTSSASISPNITANMERDIARSIPITWQKYRNSEGRNVRHGTEPQKEENGTQSTQLMSGRRCQKRSLFARFAERSTTDIAISHPHFFAATSVYPQHAAQVEKMTRQECAPSAETSSGLTVTQRLRLVERKVVGVKRCRDRRKVFDLAVEEANTFFASGVLVHNCMNALEYAAMSVNLGSPKVEFTVKAMPVKKSKFRSVV